MTPAGCQSSEEVGEKFNFGYNNSADKGGREKELSSWILADARGRIRE
jgi:hypothetical protein